MKKALSLSRSNLDWLEDLGGVIEGFAQSCTYLDQHPDGAIGAPFDFNGRAGQVMSLIVGCAMDLLSRCRYHLQLDGPRVSLIREADYVVLKVPADSKDAGAGPGAEVLLGLAETWEFDKGDGNIVIRITGRSLERGNLARLLGADPEPPPTRRRPATKVRSKRTRRPPPRR